jgi:hypothetical protein
MIRLTAEVREGVSVQIEAETQKDVFQQLAQQWEIFSEGRCGLCLGDARPKHRVVTVGTKSYDYHEYECENPDCRARLTFGQHADGSGTLFPHRKLLPNGKPDKAGEWGSHRGWTKYRGENTEQHDQENPEAEAPHRGDAPVRAAERSHVNAGEQKLNEAARSITIPQAEQIQKLAMNLGWSYATLCAQLTEKVQVSDPKNLSEKQAAQVINGLASKAKRKTTRSSK